MGHYRIEKLWEDSEFKLYAISEEISKDVKLTVK